MLTGKVVRFDNVRGYGFIAPDTGGEDVFLHVNEIQGDSTECTVGSPVRFEVVEGERGLKALGVTITRDGAMRTATSAERSTRVSAPLGGADEPLCDVLTHTEFRHEVTEALIMSVPTLTAEQIADVRECVITLADQHKWVE